jgi:hypothetical protein
VTAKREGAIRGGALQQKFRPERSVAPEKIASQARHGNAGSARPTATTKFAVYNGRERLGAYSHDGISFEAFNRLGRSLGIFSSLREAVQAINGGGAS